MLVRYRAAPLPELSQSIVAETDWPTMKTGQQMYVKFTIRKNYTMPAILSIPSITKY